MRPAPAGAFPSSKALADIEAALKSAGDDPRLYLLRAKLLTAGKSYDLAEADFLSALKMSSSGREIRELCFELSRRLEQEGLFVRSERILEAALRRYPKDIEIRLVLAQSLENRGRGAAAAAMFKRTRALLSAALAEDPASPQLWLAQAQAAAHGGKLALARAAAERLLGMVPGPDHPLFRQAHLTAVKIFVDQGEPERAEHVLRGAVAQDPELADDSGCLQLWMNQAQALADSGKFAAAEAAAGRLLRISSRPVHPFFRPTRLALAKILMNQGKHFEAETVLSAALMEDPDWREAILLSASALLKMNRLRKCLERLEKLKNAPEAVNVRLETGQILLGQGDFKLAEAAFKPLRAIAGDHFDASLFLAKLRMRQRRLKAAARAYERAWALRPQRWQIAFPLAEILLRQGKVGRMLKVLERARKASQGSKDVPALVARLRLALCLGRCGEARRLGESILNRTRRFDDLDALYRPALIDLDDFKGNRIREGYKRKIKRAFERDMASFPQSPWSYYYYRQFGDKLVGGDEEWEAHAYCLERLKTFSVRRYGWMRYHMGLDLLYARDFTGAIEQLRLALRYSRGQDWRSQCLIAEAFLCRGDLPSALAAFETAIRRASPKHAGHILVWKGEVLLWAGRYREALKVLEAALASHIVPLAHCWKGAALLKSGRHEEALAALDLAAAAGGDQEARVWRSEALYRLGRLRQARAEAESVRRVSVIPNFYGHVIAGLARGALGDGAGMLREYRRVPAEVAGYVAKKMRIGEVSSQARVRGVLEGILELSRGVRRGNYENAAWMR